MSIGFCEENFTIDLCSITYEPISFKLGMMIETIELYILILVGMTWSSFKVTVAHKKSQTLVSIFLQI